MRLSPAQRPAKTRSRIGDPHRWGKGERVLLREGRVTRTNDGRLRADTRPDPEPPRRLPSRIIVQIRRSYVQTLPAGRRRLKATGGRMLGVSLACRQQMAAVSYTTPVRSACPYASVRPSVRPPVRPFCSRPLSTVRTSVRSPNVDKATRSSLRRESSAEKKTCCWTRFIGRLSIMTDVGQVLIR